MDDGGQGASSAPSGAGATSPATSVECRFCQQQVERAAIKAHVRKLHRQKKKRTASAAPASDGKSSASSGRSNGRNGATASVSALEKRVAALERALSVPSDGKLVGGGGRGERGKTRKKTASRLSLQCFNDVYQFGSDAASGLGGLAEVSSAMKAARAEREREADCCLNLMLGDFFVVSVVAGEYKGAHMVQVFNTMGVDMVVPGNHEFDYGPDELAKRVQESKFAWLGSNLVEHAREDPRIRDSLAAMVDARGNSSTADLSALEAPEGDWPVMEGMKFVDVRQCGDFKVGFFGVCTAETKFLSYPGDTVFRPVVETAQACIAELKRRGADVFVALTHQSMQEDRALAHAVPEIHLILGGHDHIPFSEVEGHTLIHKSGQNGHHLGLIDLYIDRGGHDGAVRIVQEWSLRAVQGFVPDPTVAKVIHGYVHHLEDLRETVLCRIKSGLLSSKTSEIRAGEATFGNLLCDAILEHFGEDILDVVVMQGGSIRGDRHYHAGKDFTQYDLVHEFPFVNHVAYSRVTGAVLRGTFEAGLRALPHRAGNFLQVSRTVELAVDASRPVGERVASLKVRGKEVLDSDKYNLVCTEFIRKGGDGFHVLERALRDGTCEPLEHEAVGKVIPDILRDYVLQRKELDVAEKGSRIVITR